MKKFACGDVVPGCAAVWSAGSDDEILELVVGHAAAAHGLDPVSDQLVQQVRGLIQVAG